jgi:hypothetical protein
MGNWCDKDELKIYNHRGNSQTFSANLLTVTDYNKIVRFIKCSKDEEILFMYTNSYKRQIEIKIGQYHYVGVTNKRIFNILVNRDVFFIIINDIDKILYQTKFYKDKQYNMIVCKLKSGEKKEIDMLCYESCHYFCDYIQTLLTQSDDNLGLKYKDSSGLKASFSGLANANIIKKSIQESKKLLQEDCSHEEKLVLKYDPIEHCNLPPPNYSPPHEFNDK